MERERKVKIPSEGELIEIRHKFELLEELAGEADDRAKRALDRGDKGTAQEQEWLAIDLRGLSGIADSLLELIRELSSQAVSR